VPTQDAGIKAVVAIAASVRTHQDSAQEEMLGKPPFFEIDVLADCRTRDTDASMYLLNPFSGVRLNIISGKLGL
jgi:hypothetical protein